MIFYGDYECAYCARTHLELTGVAVVFRHFPVVSKHPRSEVLAHAAEAAALQGRFWEMHESLFADQGRIDDPHLWERARSLGLDLERFARELGDGTHGQRVRDDVAGAEAGGVEGTPTFFVNGVLHDDAFDARSLIDALEARAR